jgi:hypothetical protein
MRALLDEALKCLDRTPVPPDEVMTHCEGQLRTVLVRLSRAYRAWPEGATLAVSSAEAAWLLRWDGAHILRLIDVSAAVFEQAQRGRP